MTYKHLSLESQSVLYPLSLIKCRLPFNVKPPLPFNVGNILYHISTIS